MVEYWEAEYKEAQDNSLFSWRSIWLSAIQKNQEIYFHFS